MCRGMQLLSVDAPATVAAGVDVAAPEVSAGVAVLCRVAQSAWVCFAYSMSLPNGDKVLNAMMKAGEKVLPQDLVHVQYTQPLPVHCTVHEVAGVLLPCPAAGCML